MNKIIERQIKRVSTLTNNLIKECNRCNNEEKLIFLKKEYLKVKKDIIKNFDKKKYINIILSLINITDFYIYDYFIELITYTLIDFEEEHTSKYLNHFEKYIFDRINIIIKQLEYLGE